MVAGTTKHAAARNHAMPAQSNIHELTCDRASGDDLRTMAERPRTIRFAVTGMLLGVSVGAGMLACAPKHTNVGPHEEPPPNDSGPQEPPTDEPGTTPEEPPAGEGGATTEPQTSPEPPTGDPAKPPTVIVNPGPQKPPTTPPPKWIRTCLHGPPGLIRTSTRR
jgi:hypothetical protein